MLKILPASTTLIRWRLPLLTSLLLISIGGNIALFLNSSTKPLSNFVTLWLVCFIPYLLACLLLLSTRSQSPTSQRWELLCIFAGAFILRVMLLPIPPNLSPDSWRYLWDARVTLHGYSPYVYAPNNPLFLPLQDFIFDNSRFRNVPTIYPPGAQAIYLFSYLLAPSNLFFLKGIFVFCDLTICALLAYLLYKKNLSPTLCIIYAWCPLPIIEFAIQGHLDVLPILFTLIAVLCSQSTHRYSRILTGLFLAIATLTKIYPLIFLVAFLRQRDWSLLLTFFATIALGYLPYIILGHGQVFGFFASYASEYTPNAGVAMHLMQNLSSFFHWPARFTSLATYTLDLVIVCMTSLTILVLRQREKMSIEASILIQTIAIFFVSTHIFPWYTPALLPWITLLLSQSLSPKPNPFTSLAIIFAWYFSCITVAAYLFDISGKWNPYYQIAYTFPLLGVTLTTLLAYRYHLRN